MSEPQKAPAPVLEMADVRKSFGPVAALRSGTPLSGGCAEPGLAGYPARPLLCHLHVGHTGPDSAPLCGLTTWYRVVRPHRTRGGRTP